MPPLTTQALVLLVCNFVIFILLFANILIPKSRNQQNNDSKIARLLLLFIVVLPIMVLSIYSLNCMIVGQCTHLSWAVATVAILVCILYIIGFIMAILKKKKQRV